MDIQDVYYGKDYRKNLEAQVKGMAPELLWRNKRMESLTLKPDPNISQDETKELREKLEDLKTTEKTLLKEITKIKEIEG